MIANTPTLTEEERSLAAAIAARSKSDAEGDAVVEEVAVIFDVSIDAVRGESRLTRLVDARTVITIILRKRGWTFEEIGAVINRDHSTVFNLERRMRSDFTLRSISQGLAA